MKAEDTVMTRERIASIMMASEGYGYEKGFDIAEAQAEISFKAGIKEVVEWLERHPHILNSYHVEEWQSKLEDGFGTAAPAICPDTLSLSHEVNMQYGIPKTEPQVDEV